VGAIIMVKRFLNIMILSIMLICAFGCANMAEPIVTEEVIVTEIAPFIKIPNYSSVAPIEVIYDNNPDISAILEDYLEEHSATLVIAANYEKIKKDRFVKLEVLAYTVQVLKTDLFEHVMVVSVTPSPIYDASGNVYACVPRYFRVSSETTAEYDQDYDNLIMKLLANEDFYNTLKSIVE
jgi:hypothetical protein